MKNGLVEKFWDNGKIFSRLNFKDDKIDSLYENFYENLTHKELRTSYEEERKYKGRKGYSEITVLTDIKNYEKQINDFHNSLTGLLKKKKQQEQEQKEYQEAFNKKSKKYTEIAINSDSMTSIELIYKLNEMETEFNLEILKDLIGQTITSFTGVILNNEEYISDNNVITLTCKSGDKFMIYEEIGSMYNSHVHATIEEFTGDLNDILNTPIIIAECRSGETGTFGIGCIYYFYHIATIKGHVDIRFKCENNEYYGGYVYFVKTN
jgi:hypothetical protein